MWQKFKVRPTSNSEQKSKTKSEYCFYDNAHNDYLYTEQWIDFLTQQPDTKNHKRIIRTELQENTRRVA